MPSENSELKHDSRNLSTTPHKSNNQQSPFGSTGELSTITNPQANQGQLITYPIQPGKALSLYKNQLSDYEKGEILDYPKIWFLGLEADKIKASPLQKHNYGYDDENGDY